MNDPFTNVAAAVTDLLNAGEFGDLQFTARRSYGDSDKKLEQIPSGELLVDVIPRINPDVDLETSGHSQCEIPITVAIRKKLSPAERDTAGCLKLEDVDPLVDFVWEIIRYLTKPTNRRLLYNNAAWMPGNPVIYLFNPVDLRERGLFHAQLRFTYRAVEDLA